MSLSRPLRAELIEVLWFYCGGDAPDALDACLDVLEARADEWDDLAEAMWQVSPIEEQRDWWHPHFRIAVLREGDEQ